MRVYLLKMDRTERQKKKVDSISAFSLGAFWFCLSFVSFSVLFWSSPNEMKSLILYHADYLGLKA